MARTQLYIIWIEGFEYKTGEKVNDLTDTGFSYTTLMTESLRVKQQDIEAMKHYLKRHGVAQWVLDNPNTFVKTSYAPKGTILNLKGYAIGTY